MIIGCEATENIKETDSNELLNQGIASLKEGQYDRAIAFFKEALEIDPRNADAYHNRGRAYYYKGQYDEAISEYTKAIEINPRYAVAYHYRGMVYHKTGQHDKAITNYSKAIKIDPKYAAAYYNRGFTEASSPLETNLTECPYFDSSRIPNNTTKKASS